MNETLSVAYGDFWFDGIEKERTPSEQLWLAVLVRAVQDAVGFTNVWHQASHDHAVASAQRMFLEHQTGFARICDFADVNANEFRKVVVPMILLYQQTGLQPEFIVERQRRPRAA